MSAMKATIVSSAWGKDANGHYAPQADSGAPFPLLKLLR